MASAKKPVKAKKESQPKTPQANAVPVPVIDTAQAAVVAASLVSQKISISDAAAQTPQPESSTFRNLKESFNKPAAQSLTNMLDKHTPLGQKKSNLPFNPGKQVAHNQTFGADASRKNIPRRTGG